jgi:hypothetical protein
VKTNGITNENNFVSNSVGIYRQTIFIGDTVGIYHPCHNHRELQKNYHPCHNHRRIYSVDAYRYYYRQNISIGILQSSEIFTVHTTITDCHSVGDYRCNYRRNYSVGKVLTGIIFLARFAVCKTVGVFFLFSTELATEREITDDQYSDERIRSVKILPTNCVPYTNGMNPSVKPFNGVV